VEGSEKGEEQEAEGRDGRGSGWEEIFVMASSKTYTLIA